MADLLVAAVIGFITGGIASIIAPWVNWGIEKRRQKHEYRRELIKKWREMVVRLQTAYETQGNTDINVTFYEMLERQPDFLSLEPKLSEGEKGILKKCNLKPGVVHIVRYAENVNRINPIDNFVAKLRYRIGKIEQEWDLV